MLDHEKVYERMLDLMDEMNTMLRTTTLEFENQTKLVISLRKAIDDLKTDPTLIPNPGLLADYERRFEAATIRKNTALMGISHQQRHLTFALGRAKKFYHDHIMTDVEKADALIEQEDRKTSRQRFNMGGER